MYISLFGHRENVLFFPILSQWNLQATNLLPNIGTGGNMIQQKQAFPSFNLFYIMQWYF